MRRVVVIALMAMALPIAASAGTILMGNQFGSISISAAGISSVGSQLHSFGPITASANHSLGPFFFKTGVCLTNCSNFAAGNSTFSSVGSSIMITSGGGNPGLPKNGTVLFSGSFVGPISWTITSAPGVKNLTYTISGAIQGLLFDGRMVTGTISQNIFTVAGQLAVGVGHIRVGNTSLVVPEPGTLGLLGTGLVGIAGVFRRKFLSA